MTNNEFFEIFHQFDVPGTFVSYKTFGNGHINDTYLCTCDVNGTELKIIIQRINTNVFKKPEQVMANIVSVTGHLKKDLNAGETVLEVIKTKNGKACYNNDFGCWRCYVFIDHSLSLDLPTCDDDCYNAAFAFGNFQNKLSNFDAFGLYETIENFHNTPDRYEKFKAAVEQDVAGRAASVKDEIDFVHSHKEFLSLFEDKHKAGVLPLRVTHNDTKLNNVLLDEVTKKPLCVIDLDTVMPGYSVNDFGDMVRFGASTAAEDEKNLDLVHFDEHAFEVYAKGFIDGCGGKLEEAEIDMMPHGAKMMTLECGMRFLTDYLNGDTYFKTAYPEHNLDRCHTQFKLVAEMDEKFDKLKEIIQKYK